MLRHGNNLQEVVDEIREGLREGFGGFYRLHGDGIPHAVFLEITPDGEDFLVRTRINEETAKYTFKRDVFISDLYVLVVKWLRQSSARREKPS